MKYALVTGGSRGIGRAVSLDLAARGYHVLVNYVRNESEAQKTIALIQEAGGSASVLRFDVGDSALITEVLGSWIDSHKGDVIEVLVNNAGVRRDNLMMVMPEEDWHAVMNTNLDSFYYITKLILPGMLFNRFGRIINIVSLSGVKGLPGQTNYSASKAGLIGATKALSQEVGRRGITVNAVAPGFIKTEMTEGIEEKDYKAMIPMQRFGEAVEVAAVVTFLASREASYITGEVIHVNGGLYT